MRILLINFACGLPERGPTHRTHHLAEFWARRGHQVTLVVASNAHLQQAAEPVAGAIERCHREGVEYIVLSTPSYRGSGLSRMRNILTCLWRLRGLEAELARTGPEVVIAGTVYQLDNFSAHRIARAARAVFVRETRDLWPATLLELGRVPTWHPFVLWVGLAEKQAYRHADVVTTTLANSRDYMAARGLPGERWHYLAQCPIPRPQAPAAPLPEEHTRVLADLSTRDRKIALFAGSLVPANQLDVIIAASAALVGSNCHIVVVGRGPEETRIRAALLESPNLPLTLLPAVSQAAVPSLIATAYVGVAALGAYDIYRHGISLNKVFEYLGCGCPVVLAAAAPRNVVEMSGAGRCVPPAQPAALAAAIREFCSLSRAQRDKLGLQGQAYVLSMHDFATMATRYLELLESARIQRTFSGGR